MSISGASPLSLHEDRFFDPDPIIRKHARAIYESTLALPLICPHGHVDPAIFANNLAFPEPATLLITPDHYIVRMLYSQGLSLEALGIPRKGESHTQGDPREIWRVFAGAYHLFRGTPTDVWFAYELHELFGVRVQLAANTADYVYDQIAERLAAPEYRPRTLFERFRIEVLATTDSPSDSLEHHQAIRSSGWNGRVIPCFRPDSVFRIASDTWRSDLKALESRANTSITSLATLIDVLKTRRADFQALGATATDHAVVEPFTGWLEAAQAESLFDRACAGRATAHDQRLFEAHLLMEMARLSVSDGLVMQLHAGSFRNHNEQMFRMFGADRGADIPVATEFTRNLHALLNAFGNHPDFSCIVFTLDESTYARELAPLAGHYPALRLGPPWWFHDSIQGMKRFREQTMETAGIYNTAGFNDDTRAFCSIPARHDLSRRVDANYLAGLVARHVIDLEAALQMARLMACDLARATYKLAQ